MTDASQAVAEGRTALGIELGSTRIKAVLTGPDHAPLARGTWAWASALVDGRWTYALDDVWTGLQGAYADLAADVERRHGVELRAVGALGVSAMMHGYLAFDGGGALLVPFRTWRNTSTARASAELSATFGRNVPDRWSVAHLYQAMLEDEEHLDRLASLTTLAGYVHRELGGDPVLGIGDASGMFPIDPETRTYDAELLEGFDKLAAEAGHPVTLADLLPPTRVAGQAAGALSEAGARRLDPTGRLASGVPLCPPEGDAGTGMVATNAVAPRSGNVSVGTSVFAMVVLERGLGEPHRELDEVTTPVGDPVAMVHCNNGTGELDAWVRLFTELADVLGVRVSSADLYPTLLGSIVRGAVDGGGLTVVNYLSGEPITGLDAGRPLLVRAPGSGLDLGTLMRTQLYAVLATLRLGMDVLREEGIGLERLVAHGGLFTTPFVAQGVLAAALNTPVQVYGGAGEGGAWGAAVLAAYLHERPSGRSLTEYLRDEVFADAGVEVADPDPAEVAGFEVFLRRFVAALPVEKEAVDHV